jgi:hypothetical protein
MQLGLCVETLEDVLGLLGIFGENGHGLIGGLIPFGFG